MVATVNSKHRGIDQWYMIIKMMANAQNAIK